MAHYPRATRYPSLEELRTEFSNQHGSARFSQDTTHFATKANTSIDNLVRISVERLNSVAHRGVEDLADFMSFLNTHFGQDYVHDSGALYKAVKGLPFHSHGRIAYTFQRRRTGLDRGVFIFLRQHPPTL